MLGLTVAGCAALVVSAVYGLVRLEQHVYTDDAFQHPPSVSLPGAPEGIRQDLLTALEPLLSTPWSEPRLCREIGRVLDSHAWVAAVEAVRKYADGRIEARCRYRQPRVLVLCEGRFFLVSDDGVRLPGAYRYDPRLIVVEGVATAPPPAGGPWEAPDLAAGVKLAQCLQGEPFADQITAVEVQNFGGRQDSEQAHIRLVTDRPAEIIWGSAPGLEVEENSLSQKLSILRANYQRFGRADANRRQIDISVHPDRFITPA
jgi:hypothetical protein